MANTKKITALPVVTTLADADLIPVVADGVTSKITKANLGLAVDTGITAVEQDATPTLGGDLDADSHNITDVGTINGVGFTSGTGELVLNDFTLEIEGGDINIVGSNANTFTFPDESGTIALVENSPQISSGTTAPDSTPTKVGDIYIDTSAKKLYFATGTTSSSDWTIAN